MARLLLSLGDSDGQPGRKGTEIALHLTREEMAEIVGTTQETAIRVLSQFRRKGFVRVDHRSITVLDPEGLSALAG
jgi:CRP/FNR family transcriptional regulator